MAKVPINRTWMNYPLAVVAVAAALLVHWVLLTALGTLPTYITFYTAVVLVAMLLGARAGVLATVLSGFIATYFFIPPLYSLRVADPSRVVALGLFVTAGLIVSWMAERLDRARRHVAEAAERERTREALLRSAQETERQRRLLAVTLASIGDAVIVTDAQGRITFLNPEAERLTAWTSAEAAGEAATGVFDIINEQTRQTAENPVDEVLRLGRIVGLANHTVLIARDGRRTPIDDSGAPIREGDGTMHGVVLVFRDITERKRAEEELTAAKRLAEEAKEAAEAASRAKDQFLAVLSHELRTPLTPVLAGMSLLLAEPHLDSDMRQNLEMVQRNAELEARLVDDLLDLNRITQGRLSLHKRPVPLCEIILHAVEVCQPDIDARQLHFSLDLCEGVSPVVEADPARLQQVFWNLLKNALKFTPSGGSVSIRCRRDDDGHVVAAVTDNGAGIEPAALERIFKPFEQAEQPLARQFGGLGLGLTICRSLVEMHGGTIEAESPGKGKGATFRVRLPVMSPEAAARPVTKGGLAPGGEDSSTLGGPGAAPSRPLRVLLVEDHGDTAKVLSRLLVRHGHKVQTAGDVGTAIELAGRQSFDLLVSDLGLPDRSGLELIRELRAAGQNMPAIALSGYGQEEDVERSLEAGFNEHLTKPVDFGQFFSLIAALAQGEPSASHA